MLNLNLENNGNIHTVTASSVLGLLESGFECGMGNNGIVGGAGFRCRANPSESIDLYGFTETSNGTNTHRSEKGIYVSSGFVESVVLIAIFAPKIGPLLLPLFKIFQTILGPIKSSFFSFLLNGDINKQSCDLEEN